MVTQCTYPDIRKLSGIRLEADIISVYEEVTILA